MNARRGNGGKPLLGEILLGRGLITKEILAHALRVQAGGLRRVGYLLVKMKYISDVQLLDAISEQLEIPVVQVENEFRAEARRLLPRYLCRKFTVLPLALEEDNVVRLAMVDPLDDVAIREVENFTGKVVRPLLANMNDIRRGIGRHVPLSRQDLFNPEVCKLIAKISATAAVVLLLVAGYLTYQEVQRWVKGTTTRGTYSVMYKNHDLMVDVSTKDGAVNFSGRGAFADGYYGVRFANVDGLSMFLKSQEAQLSEAQRKWLGWVLRNLPQGGRKSPARAAGDQRGRSNPG